MEIAPGVVATIHYTLTDDDGTVIDQSSPQRPLSYLHGAGNIVPGLEQALEGKRSGDHLTAQVGPELGYGPRIEQLVQQVPRQSFPDADTVSVGMQFEARTQQGPLIVTVTHIGDDSVTVDGNHPLAGQTLNFEVNVADVRAATLQEANDGQVDGTR
ncbi:FKBP-type peptidyl-prolyl cis-trans isomerase [Pseudoxanthomonas composti]|uniref:Peptidyl-prolyl cis-trans isomerase n=1 Tax=Pseudoxanthomonas composti TaxID=2137479 RepID=A0A4Q1JZM4_9GAMM|nr:peptidylprolyl isomerase [Pseudoxanthomonas composti]RXR07167.1 peptidylprolyl isomerase [Pseudoxanthomonas composti]